MLRGTLALPLLLTLVEPAAGQDFKVIAHPDQAVAGLSIAQASRLFLKKETRWPDGTLVRPVVLAQGRLRDAFCRRVHGKSGGAVHAYWNQMIFSGHDIPPIEKRTAEEVVQFVRGTPGAIGFVPADTPAAGVRVVALRE